MTKDQDPARELTREVARIRAGILALVFGAIGGMGLFIMTVWLLIQGGPQVGQHLQLLGNYFIGYSVTWRGACVGFFYGAVTGGLIGWGIGVVYNRVVGLRSR